ncbi:hypothetical protein EDEG_03073 [Edhazardia aedis USNM 41457]|uniref:Uncharacterized protein n=1 Tax=Edhazardia aedis (strain USNM 41457) TaxID=1003232 RepID=J9D4P4_EDHAE|nr:hypothetical protein EDEG_03073 [Edhazardia aedis USNM 41457]|eukprot:EJW02519.1 hypothetical protein EDEG_03073 [Edhazardia aedis USNM 41457]
MKNEKKMNKKEKENENQAPPKIDCRRVFKLYRRGLKKMIKEVKIVVLFVCVTFFPFLIFTIHFIPDSIFTFEEKKMCCWHTLNIILCCFNTFSSFILTQELYDMEMKTLVQEMKEKRYTSYTFYLYIMLHLFVFNIFVSMTTAPLAILIVWQKIAHSFYFIVLPWYVLFNTMLSLSFNMVFGYSLMGKIISGFCIATTLVPIYNYQPFYTKNFFNNTFIEKFFEILIMFFLILPFNSIVFFIESIYLNFLKDEMVLDVKYHSGLIDRIHLFLTNNLISKSKFLGSFFVIVPFWIIMGIWRNNCRIASLIKTSK